MLLSELDAEARRSSPPNVIDSCGALALIFRHPFHGQGFAAKGVSQQPLQGFHLAPAAFSCALQRDFPRAGSGEFQRRARFMSF